MFELEDCVGIITCNTGKKIADAFNEKLSAFGITRTQWIAIYYLGKFKSLNQKELSVKMNIKDSTLVRLIDRLERDGLALRIKNNKDRRMTHLKLTDMGKQKRAEMLPIGEEFVNCVSSGLSNEEIDTFRKVMNRLMENIE